MADAAVRAPALATAAIGEGPRRGHIVELVGATTTTKGLRIKAERDTEW